MACPELVEPGDVPAWLESNRHEAPVRLGVLSNPAARQNRVLPIHQHLTRAMADPGAVIETRRPGDLRRALIHLLFRRRANVIAANGGDGTLHTVVNALWDLLDEVEARFGVAMPSPHVLFLNGGTMNMVSRAMNTRENAVRTVRWFLREYGGRPLGALRTRRQRVLCAERPDRPGRSVAPRQVGFIFGSQLVYNALWLYEYLGTGYGALLRFLGHAMVGVRWPTPLWRRYGHMIDMPKGAAIIDGVEHAPYAALVASTIDMTLLKGVVSALHVAEGSPGFHAKLILETDRERLIGMIPELMRERRHPRVLDVEGAQEVTVRGDYTLDGELYAAHGEEPDEPVLVTAASRVLPAIHNEDD
ncbi:MAG: hypothetical protein AMXMBFR64_16760 [Myxococcales bacterium]